MKLASFTLVALCALVISAPAGAATITFGSGPDQFDMEFVEIGDAGNAADTTGNPNPAGAVPYVYNMGKFEVSRDMITKANNLGGLGITLSTSSFFTSANQPATDVSWNEAARFVNWLNTSEGFSPAYKFEFQPGDVGYSSNANIQLWTGSDAGFDPTNPFRNSEAQYFLPSVDEWYKAAYYDPVSDTYFDFPTGSDTAPTAVASGTASGTAVFDGQSGPADIMDAGGLSPFGVMALGGNVWEWEETEFDLMNDSVSSGRGVRGGDWARLSSFFSSSSRFSVLPVVEDFLVGFRVASQFSEAAEFVIPEPGSGGMLLTGMLVLLSRRRQVRKTSL